MGLHHPMPDMLPSGASATVDRLPVPHQQQQQAEEEEGERREGGWERHEQEENRRAEDEGRREENYHAAKDYHAKEYHHDHYRMAGADEELPDSPTYNQSGFQDSSQYGETSASASNSG